MKLKTTPLILVALLAAFAIGRCSGGSTAEPAPGSTAPTAAADWTCPMHPQVVQPEFGACPLCGMDLVPQDAAAGGPPAVHLDPATAALAGVVTAPVERRALEFELPLIGTVALDTATIRAVTITVPGRIERLFVDSVGMDVREGDHLYELYSPGLLSAQEEIVAAAERFTRAASGESGFALESAERSYLAARSKLRLWGLSSSQVDEIEMRGQASDRVEFRSAYAGTVVEHTSQVGDYVHAGGQVMTLANLEHLWVELEAYEQDLPFLRYGQTVGLSADALPGETLEGTVTLIEPEVDRVTRTAVVRVHVLDPHRRLKPGMFVRAAARVSVDERGRARGPNLAGKWISPMHPEVVADGPGLCTVCGMDLVPAEDLGLVSAAGGEPLVVPRTAVLTTGRRALVYVEHEADGERSYRPREVRLGPLAGAWYVVLEGLEPGERVAVQGAFRLDSEMQLAAGPGLLSLPSGSIPDAPLGVPEGAAAAAPGSHSAHGHGDDGHGAPVEHEQPAAAVTHGDGGHAEPAPAAEAAGPGRHAELWEAYLEASTALADDDSIRARSALDRLAVAAGEASASAPDERALIAAIAEAAGRPTGMADMAAQRVAFDDISEAALALLESAGNRAAAPLRVAFCPMAFNDRGARWLQSADGPLANPYFGDLMLRCGVFEREVPAE